jgi:hypothetical protein
VVLVKPADKAWAYAEEKHLWGKETGGCMILIESGSLGINAVASLDPEYTLQFRHFTGASNAKEQAAGKLTEGMVLTHINGVDQRAVVFDDVVGALKARPCKLQFVTLGAAHMRARAAEQAREAANLAKATRYATEKAEREKQSGGCMLTIQSGSLGLNVETSLDPVCTMQFCFFTGQSNAEEQAAGKLSKGMVLTHVNGADQKGVSYDGIVSSLQARPCKLQFMVYQRRCKRRRSANEQKRKELGQKRLHLS